MTSVAEPSVIPSTTYLACGLCSASKTKTTPGRCTERFGAENLIFCDGSHFCPGAKCDGGGAVSAFRGARGASSDSASDTPRDACSGLRSSRRTPGGG